MHKQIKLTLHIDELYHRLGANMIVPNCAPPSLKYRLKLIAVAKADRSIKNVCHNFPLSHVLLVPSSHLHCLS
jgi:hypothetical protein